MQCHHRDIIVYTVPRARNLDGLENVTDSRYTHCEWCSFLRVVVIDPGLLVTETENRQSFKLKTCDVRAHRVTIQ